VENAIWNLIIKISGIAGGILLLASSAVITGAAFGVIENSAAGAVALPVGTGLIVFSLGSFFFVNMRLQKELRAASEAARDISLGKSFEGEAKGEILTSLRGISIYIREKSDAASRIAAGDLAATVELRSESDALGRSLQNMIKKLRPLVQTPGEKDGLQRAFGQLADDISAISEGDLSSGPTCEVPAVKAVTQALAVMTDNLRSSIEQIRALSSKVGDSALDSRDSTEQIINGIEAQSSQLSRTVSSISNMARQLQEVSSTAAASVQTAADSLDRAHRGRESARDNIDAMNAIRKHVQESAIRIKKLGERSQEISQAVKLIDDLSDQTSLLALNASLQASTASESGQGSIVIIEEMERLAERSRRLTQQMSASSRSLLAETKSVVAAMEETTHQVVIGSALANKIGNSLVESERISGNLVVLLQSVSDSTKHQAKSSADIYNAAAGISKLNEVVRAGANRNAETAKTLAGISSDLRNSLSRFKLRQDRNPQPLPSSENSRFVH
jgi:twitching motility protein PilJ